MHQAVSRAWQAAMVTGRTATSGARAAAGTAADAPLAFQTLTTETVPRKVAAVVVSGRQL